MAGDAMTIRTIDQEILENIGGVLTILAEGILKVRPFSWANRYYQSVKELPTTLANDSHQATRHRKTLASIDTGSIIRASFVRLQAF